MMNIFEPCELKVLCEQRDCQNCNFATIKKEYLLECQNTNDEKEFYQTIIDKLGKEHQIKKTIEELAELIRALTRLGNLDNLKEEIADVEIMLKQIKIIFNLQQEEIDSIGIKKLNKLKEMIENL